MSTHPGRHGMSLVVKTVTGWLKAFILLFGIYIVLYGHLTPGGGFAGGVVVALVAAVAGEGHQVHAADRALAGLVLHHLGMHAAGPELVRGGGGGRHGPRDGQHELRGPYLRRRS